MKKKVELVLWDEDGDDFKTLDVEVDGVIYFWVSFVNKNIHVASDYSLKFGSFVRPVKDILDG